MAPDTIWNLLPEIVLVAVAVAIYLGGAFAGQRRPWGFVAGCGLLASAVALWQWSAPLIEGESAQGSPLAGDAPAYFGRWLALVLGALLVMLMARPRGDESSPEDPQAERIGSLLLIVVGMMLVCGASELILLFVGLELISIPTYILLYIGRRGSGSREAATKYFFLSIFASAILLYGFSFLYGTTGATDLTAIAAGLGDGGSAQFQFAPLVKVAFVLVFAGLGFKIAAVPFHFYAADVYQGTTHANAAMLSVIPRSSISW